MYRGKYKVIRLSEINSTNLFASALLSCGLISDPAIVIAEYQTEGRGQGSNTWQSRPGENLLFSIIHFPKNISASDQFYISKTASVSVRETLSEYTNHAIIKWPNDILAGIEKISGILIENSIEGERIRNTIIGIGINVNQSDFSTKPYKATSLKMILGREMHLDSLMAKLIERFEHWYELLDSGGYDEIDHEYFTNLYGFQNKSKFLINGHETEGIILDIEKDGRMVVKFENGEKNHFGFREIEFML